MPMPKFIRYFIAVPASLIVGSTAGIFSPVLSEFTPSAATVAQTPSGRYQPLPAATCNQLKQAMSKVLNVKVTMTQAAFQDYLQQGRGTGCQLTATGNGRNFRNVDIITTLSTLLTQQGWVKLSNYDADGPTGGARWFRKGNSLASFSSEWEPSADAKCAEDMPISDCELSPEQELYRITLQAARR